MAIIWNTLQRFDEIHHNTNEGTSLTVELLHRHIESALSQLEEGAVIFAHRVTNPQAYGVVEFDQQGQVLSLEEKPTQPRSPYAVPGIYFYDAQVTDLAATLQPSDRGELEITDLNRLYLAQGKLRSRVLWRGYTWLDMGTHGDLLQAAMFIQTLEQRQGFKVACVEEIAYRMGFIDEERLKHLAQPLLKSGYGEYLLELLADTEANPVIYAG